METRKWLAILAGAAFITFTAYPVLARDAAAARAGRRGDIVLIGDNTSGPDADWVEVPSGNSQSDTGGDNGAQTVDQDSASADSGSAPVTIVEYGDYECPYCRREEPTLHQLRREYGGDIRIVFRDFPLKRHPGAMEAAIAARCAGEQGAFRQYHDALYSGRYGFSTQQLEAVARTLGLDLGTFNTCLQGQHYKDEVAKEIADAQRLGVHATPTFLINGRKWLVGEQSLSSFKSVIHAQLTANGP